jgi:hypothetical protein
MERRRQDCQRVLLQEVIELLLNILWAFGLTLAFYEMIANFVRVDRVVTLQTYDDVM